MNNVPDGADLLAIAREALLAELRPLLPARAGYTVAMIANAMAVAAREAEAGEKPLVASLVRLERLYGEAARDLHGDALHAAVAEFEKRIAHDIRSGGFDANDARRRELLDHLRESVASRLRISNPKSLKA